MATNNRGGSRGSNRGRNGRNNNPEGRNQYSGISGTVRENPLTTAVAVGGAVAAGLFLWSRRNEISDQISSLADQISEWREGIGSDRDFPRGGTSLASTSHSPARGGHRSQAEIAGEALTLKEIGKPA